MRYQVQVVESESHVARQFKRPERASWLVYDRSDLVLTNWVAELPYELTADQVRVEIS